MRYAKHLATRPQQYREPLHLVDVDVWPTLPELARSYARHYMRAFNSLGAVAIEVHTDDLNITSHRIWLWTKQSGVSLYTLLRTIEPKEIT